MDADPDGIEAEFPPDPGVRVDPVLGSSPEFAPLAGADRFEGILRTLRAGLHLHERHRVPIPGHDVELAPARSPVAVEDLQAASLEEVRRGAFGPRRQVATVRR